MQKNKIKIALLWSKYSGGVTSVNDLVLRLDERRFNVTFIYLSGYGIDKNLIEDAGYKVLYLCNKKRSRIFSFSVLFKLIKILKEYKIDIIHCHAHKPTVYGTIAATFAHTPVIVSHIHGLGRTRNLKRKVMNFLLFRKIDRIIPVAETVKQDVIKSNWFVPQDKIFVLENSVDYERFTNVSISKEDAKRILGIAPNAFVFGTVGRLAPTKGLTYLIEAFSIVKKQLPAAHLVVLGDGPGKAKLEKKAENMSCSDSVHFLGFKDNIENLLQGLDVFVISSIAEGMPRALLEAMAAGIPCICTKVGGLPEVICSEEFGCIVEPKDSETLAEAMIRMANLPEKKLAEIRKKAQDRVREIYSHQVVRNKLQKLYEDAFEACGRNR